MMEKDNKVNAGKARKRVVAGGQRERHEQGNNVNRSERISEACSREETSSASSHVAESVRGREGAGRKQRRSRGRTGHRSKER